MIRLIARFIAKRQYIFKLEHEAATNDVNAKLAFNRAQEKRTLIEQLNKDADAIDENIARKEEKLETGFWECPNGHEVQYAENTSWPASGVLCGECDYKGSMKFIKLDQMTGQEKYESDKDKDEAKKVATDKRHAAEEEAKNVSEGEKAAQYFRGMADNGRATADKIKRL